MIDFSYIIISIAIIIPGFITYRVSKLSVYKVKVSTFYTTLYSIIYSIIVWIIIIFILKQLKCMGIDIQYGIINNIEDILYYKKSISIERVLDIFKFFIVIYIISFFIGVIIARLKLKYRKDYNKIYAFFFKRSQYQDAIDQVFEAIIYDDTDNKNIIFKTISGEYFIGEVASLSDNLNGKYIYFSRVQKYLKKEREFLDISKDYGFCIKLDNIEYMHIIPLEDFDYKNYLK